MHQIYSFIFRSLGLSDNLDILDTNLMSWIFFAFFVIIAVNIYQKYFGRLKFQRHRLRVDSHPGDGWVKQGNARPGVESAEWLTCLVSWWVGADSAWQPVLITHWLKSVNEELKKFLMSECELVIEKLIFSSEGQSLQCYNLSTDTRNGNELILRMDLKLSDVTMEIKIKNRNQSNQHTRDNRSDTLLVLLSMQSSIKILLSRLDVGLPGGREQTGSSCIRVRLSHSGQPTISKLKIISGGLTDNSNTESLEKSLREGISHAGLIIEVSQNDLTYKTGNSLNTPTIPTFVNRVGTESGYSSLLLENSNVERTSGVEHAHPIHDGRIENQNETQEWLEYKKLWTNGYTENKASTAATLAENKIQKETGISNGIDKVSLGRNNESKLHSQAGHPPEYSISSTDKEENDAEVKLHTTSNATEVSNLSTISTTNNEQAENREKKEQNLVNGEPAPTSREEEAPQKKGFFSRTFSSKSKKRSSSAERPKSFTLVDINLDLDADKGGTLTVQPKLENVGTLTPKSSEKVQPKQDKYSTLTPKSIVKEKGTKSNKKSGTVDVSEANKGDTLKVESKLDKSDTLTPKSGEKVKEKADTRKSRKSGMAEVEISSDGSTLRKARSNSLSSSFRNLFKRNRHKSGQSGGGLNSVPPSRDEPLSLHRDGREILLDTEKSQTNDDTEKLQTNAIGINAQDKTEELKIASGNDQITTEILQKEEIAIQKKLEGVPSEEADLLNNNNNTGLGLMVQSTVPLYQQGLQPAKQTISSN